MQMLLPCLVELWDHKLDAELLIFSFAPEQQVQTHELGKLHIRMR